MGISGYSSYAVFSDEIISNNEIHGVVQMKKEPQDTSGANHPLLSTNMIPVYYDETNDTWKKADSSNMIEKYKWYDYDSKMWANAVTVTDTSRSTYLNAKAGTEIPMSDINTMWVWIPRYKYRVWNYNLSGTVSSSPQTIEIIFEKGKSKTGEIRCTDAISGISGAVSEICKVNNTNCTDALCNNKTYTHPAFTFGSEELTGLWFGKFQISMIGENINIKPDVQVRASGNISTHENNIMAMNDVNNIYGLTTNVDTHMIKNTEWGAMAYFSHSKYGANREIYINNSSQYYAGRSGGNVYNSTPINGTYQNQSSTEQYNAYGFYTYDGYLLNYNTNNKSTTRDLTKVSSSTGNIYGIYDITGSAQEQTMANVIYSDGVTSSAGDVGSGYTGMSYNGPGTPFLYNGVPLPEKKYYDIYSYNDYYTNQDAKKGWKLGDAVREIYVSTENSRDSGWYGVVTTVYSFRYSWIYRGGAYKYGAGLFKVADSSAPIGGSTHAILVIN